MKYQGKREKNWKLKVERGKLVKSRISVCCRNTKLYRTCRDRRPRRSNVVSVTNCIFVYCQNKDNIRKQYIYLLFKDRRDAGPYKFDIIFMFRQQINARWWSPQSLPLREHVATNCRVCKQTSRGPLAVDEWSWYNVTFHFVHSSVLTSAERLVKPPSLKRRLT